MHYAALLLPAPPLTLFLLLEGKLDYDFSLSFKTRTHTVNF